MTVKRVTVEEFKRHCSDDVEEVTGGELTVELTINGTVVAKLSPSPEIHTTGTLADVIGTGLGVEFAADYDPDAPACDPEDWEAVRE